MTTEKKRKIIFVDFNYGRGNRRKICEKHCTRSIQKIRGLFELRGSSWFQENPLGVARFVQIS